MKSGKVLVSILCAAILFNMEIFTSQAKPHLNNHINPSTEISFLSNKNITDNGNIDPFSEKIQWIYKTIDNKT